MEGSILSTQKNNDSDTKIDAPKKLFPTDVLKWMKANAKPKMALKLMQICKYFKHKEFPYFVVSSLTCNYSDGFSYMDLNGDVHKLGNIAAIPNNFCITNDVHILKLPEIPSVIPQLIAKIGICDAKIIQIRGEKILFNDFKILTSSGAVRRLIFVATHILNEINEIPPFEDILECIPNIEYIGFYQAVPSFSTIDAAKKEWILSNLKEIQFYGIGEYFNISEFIEFIQNHKSVIFELCFDSVDNAYRLQLQAFVDGIIAAADLQYPPPFIRFPSQTEECEKALEALVKRFSENFLQDQILLSFYDFYDIFFCENL